MLSLVDSLGPHGLQHTRLPYPSLSPGVCSNSSPLSWRCHRTIQSSVGPFSSCPQSFTTSGSFPVSQLFPSGGQSWSFSFSISPSNELSGLISFRMDCFALYKHSQRYLRRCFVNILSPSTQIHLHYFSLLRIMWLPSKTTQGTLSVILYTGEG